MHKCDQSFNLQVVELKIFLVFESNSTFLTYTSTNTDTFFFFHSKFLSHPHTILREKQLLYNAHNNPRMRLSCLHIYLSFIKLCTTLIESWRFCGPPGCIVKKAGSSKARVTKLHSFHLNSFVLWLQHCTEIRTGVLVDT